MGNIQEIWQKIKNATEDVVGEWGLLAIIILVGLSSFGLGRLSAIQDTKPAVSITQAQAASAAHVMTVGGLVVASRTGSTYHFPWCAGAQSIKEANKVWFKNEEAARKAGYAPAKNCKGLK